MEITLRKANAIQHEIKDKLRQLDEKVSLVYEVTEFTEADEVIDASSKIVITVGEAERLRKAYFDIRRQVGRRNVTSGIADLLADVAEASENMNTLKKIVGASTLPSKKKINERILSAKESKGDRSYSFNSTNTVGTVTEGLKEHAEIEIAALKRQKASLQDKLLELNISATIHPSDETVETLQKHGII